MGCTDPTSINFSDMATEDDGSCMTLVGLWDVNRIITDDGDAIGDVLDEATFEFEADEDFRFEAIDLEDNGRLLRITGSWELNVEDLELDLFFNGNPSEASFCEERRSTFDIRFTDSNNVRLEIENCDGDFIRFELIR